MSGEGDEGIDLPRLRRLLGGPGTAWLVDRIRRRLAREEPLTGVVSLSGPTAEQREAAERLLGRAPRGGGSLSVRLEAVDGILRRSGVSPSGLVAAVTALGGPVLPRSLTREAEARAWQHAYAPLTGLPAEFDAWAAQLRAAGTVRRLARSPEHARALLEAAVAALRDLPVAPPVSLPVFAARTLGSAHALDDGTPLATLVLSGARALNDIPDGQGGAERRREMWQSVGLLKDDVSSTVLVLNLRGTPALDWHADAGEPAVLTLRQLARQRTPAQSADAVRVCENPAVVSAAAERHGPACRPLVCLQGQPSAAALTLLRTFHTDGTTLRYHGDFDWGGLRIAATLLGQVPWRPWRYTAADYREAAARSPRAPALTGTPADSPWDTDLAAALAEVSVRIEEESVLEDLLTDLAP
ncbi:TIGR02679 family protein [Streptomyces sp. NPDC006992]|uniref:TIGR02679 family protein n=1 Tax=unclassified Streptomyces TaxID=2593676 RepID=UPI0033CE501C